MSNIVKATQKSIVSSKSVSGAAGKGMVVAGAGGLLITLLAGLIPFLGVVGVSVLLVIFGFLMWE